MKAALITAASPWQVVDVHACVDSTNLEALRDPRPWRVVVADFQSAGRGRLARQWRAPSGTSVAVSAVVPVPASRAGDLGWLPLLSGMAMQAALAHVAHLAAGLKWPNDVLVQERQSGQSGQEGQEGQRGHVGHAGQVGQVGQAGPERPTDPGAPWLKISGILCEMVPGGGQVVIGAGANITQQRSELPVETATSLALCGAANVRREDVIVGYLTELADLHHTWAAGGTGLAGLRAAYRAGCLTIGLDVDVHEPDGQVARGTATGVDDTGRLVVMHGGSSRAHAAGDIVHVRRSLPPAGNTA